MSNTPSSDPFSDSGFINQSSSISPPDIHNLPTPLVPKRQHTFKRIEKRTIDVDTLLEDNRDSIDQPTTDDIDTLPEDSRDSVDNLQLTDDTRFSDIRIDRPVDTPTTVIRQNTQRQRKRISLGIDLTINQNNLDETIPDIPNRRNIYKIIQIIQILT